MYCKPKFKKIISTRVYTNSGCWQLGGGSDC